MPGRRRRRPSRQRIMARRDIKRVIAALALLGIMVALAFYFDPSEPSLSVAVPAPSS